MWISDLVEFEEICFLFVVCEMFIVDVLYKLEVSKDILVIKLVLFNGSLL